MFSYVVNYGKMLTIKTLTIQPYMYVCILIFNFTAIEFISFN